MLAQGSRKVLSDFLKDDKQSHENNFPLDSYDPINSSSKQEITGRNKKMHKINTTMDFQAPRDLTIKVQNSETKVYQVNP